MAKSTPRHRTPPTGDVATFDEVRTSAQATVQATRTLTESASACAKAMTTVARHQVVTQPYVALGVAAGVGFVVGGGLAAPATRSLMGLGGRVALAALTRRLMSMIDVVDDAGPNPKPVAEPRVPMDQM